MSSVRWLGCICWLYVRLWLWNVNASVYISLCLCMYVCLSICVRAMFACGLREEAGVVRCGLVGVGT